EAAESVQIGTLNGLFVLGRSIGLCGHFLDQKRLKQPLYRHPADDNHIEPFNPRVVLSPRVQTPRSPGTAHASASAPAPPRAPGFNDTLGLPLPRRQQDNLARVGVKGGSAIDADLLSNETFGTYVDHMSERLNERMPTPTLEQEREREPLVGLHGPQAQAQASPSTDAAPPRYSQ
ncbi:hypothetical protein JCM3770_001806, partial [Rhodotorula araucariae]